MNLQENPQSSKTNRVAGKHEHKFVIPVAWKHGQGAALDVVGGYHYRVVEVSKLMCECGATKVINKIFRSPS